MKQTGLKQALNSQNIELIIKKFKEFKLYILSLKNKNNELVCHSRRKTGLLGFLICIESALILFEELCVQNNYLKYIPFYKLSQDHIELLFGCIRHHGGGNNNPTVRQFKTAMKKILVHSDLRDSNTGNCISLEEISILHVSSAGKIKNSEDIINSTSRLSRLCDELDANNNNNNNDTEDFNFVHDHNYIPHVQEISEFSINIIEYIARYVVMQLKKKLICETCVNALTANSDNYKNNLITIKSRGGLIQPSADVITICRKCETEIRSAIHLSETFIQWKFNTSYLSNQVLKQLINIDLFENLNIHAHDQSLMENHIAHLIQAIVNKYIKIRLHYIALNSIDKSNR